MPSLAASTFFGSDDHEQKLVRPMKPICVFITALALCGSACTRVGDWWLGPGQNIQKTLSVLDPDRIVIVRSRPGNQTQVAEIRERAAIREILAFFERYPDGWKSLSAASGEYDFYLYRGSAPIDRLGLNSASGSSGEATLNVGDYFRHVPSTDVEAFAKRLHLPWPPTR